jgi:hypothetical protein
MNCRFSFDDNLRGDADNADDTDADESRPLLEADVTVAPQRASRGRAGSRDRIPASIADFYNITEIIEMGKMASLFFNRFGESSDWQKRTKTCFSRTKKEEYY